jgi:hypothetical protein
MATVCHWLHDCSGPSSAGGALENVIRERAGLDAQLPPVVQASADLLEPIAQRRDDGLFLSVGALFDA